MKRFSPRKFLKSWFQGLIFTCLGLLVLNRPEFQELLKTESPPAPLAQLDRTVAPLLVSTAEDFHQLESAISTPAVGTIATDAHALATISPQTYFDPKVAPRFRPLIAYSVGQNSTALELIAFFSKVARAPTPTAPEHSALGNAPLEALYHHVAIGLLLEEMAYRNDVSFLPVLEEFRKSTASPLLIAQSSLAIESIQFRTPLAMRETQAQWLREIFAKSRSTAAELSTLARVDDYQDMGALSVEIIQKIRADLKIKPAPGFEKLERQVIQGMRFLQLSEFERLPRGIVNEPYGSYVISRVDATLFEEKFLPKDPETKQTANLSMTFSPGKGHGDLRVYRSAEKYDLLLTASALIHEARHVDGPDHGTCPINPKGEACGGFDRSYEEQGSYGAELEFLARVHLHGKNFSNYIQKVAGYYALDLMFKSFGKNPIKPMKALAILDRDGSVEVLSETKRDLRQLKLPRQHFAYYNGYSLSLIPQAISKTSNFKYFDLFSKEPAIWEDTMPLRPLFFGPGSRALHQRFVARVPLEFKGKAVLDFVAYDFDDEKHYAFLTSEEIAIMILKDGKFQSSQVTFEGGIPGATKLSVHFNTAFPVPTLFLTNDQGDVIYRQKIPFRAKDSGQWANDPENPEWRTELFPANVVIQKPVLIGPKFMTLDRVSGRILHEENVPAAYLPAIQDHQGKIKDAMEIELWNFPALLSPK